MTDGLYLFAASISKDPIKRARTGKFDIYAGWPGKNSFVVHPKFVIESGRSKVKICGRSRRCVAPRRSNEDRQQHGQEHDYTPEHRYLNDPYYCSRVTWLA
jgi:hypothetical protein